MENNGTMDRISKILIPTDFSPAAWKAVHFGLSLAEKHGAEVALFHVYPSQNKYMSWLKAAHAGDPEIIEQLNEKLKTFTDELKLRYKSPISHHITSGNVTNEIINYAKNEAFDLVIIGVNSGSLDNEPGSNTSEIIQRAGFPVLVIPGVVKTKSSKTVSAVRKEQ